MAGSVVGHGISNMLFGGRQAEAPPPAEYAQQQGQQATQMGNCDIPAKGESRDDAVMKGRSELIESVRFHKVP